MAVPYLHGRMGRLSIISMIINGGGLCSWRTQKGHVCGGKSLQVNRKTHNIAHQISNFRAAMYGLVSGEQQQDALYITCICMTGTALFKDVCSTPFSFSIRSWDARRLTPSAMLTQLCTSIIHSILPKLYRQSCRTF